MSVTRRDDRGAAAPLIAIALFLLLLGMAALAIDVGAGFNERRLDQGAVDVSTLAGALESVTSSGPSPLQDALDELKLLVDTNLSTTIPQADWNSCNDAGVLYWRSDDPLLGLTGGSECISFNQGFTRIRGRVPDQDVDTTFGVFLGVDRLISSAIAEVTLLPPGGSGSFPSGVFANSAQGAEFCIKTGPNANNSCGAPTTGDFGNFEPYFYTDVNPGGTNTICNTGNQPFSLPRAMADGVDHFLGFTPSMPGNRINGDDCPAFGGPAFPNRVDSGSGYSNTDVTNGLLAGGNWDGAFTGRLTRSFTSGYGAATIFTYSIDNRPLWRYIDTSAPLHPDCTAASLLPTNPPDALAYAAAKTQMGLCLQNQNGLLFTDDIDLTTRLASIPRYWQPAPLPSNSCCYDIQEFVPIFIEGLWTAHGPSWTCSGAVEVVPGSYCKHEPGMIGSISVPSPGQRQVDSASAFLLDCDHLPDEICARISTGGGPSVSVLFKLFLAR